MFPLPLGEGQGEGSPRPLPNAMYRKHMPFKVRYGSLDFHT